MLEQELAGLGHFADDINETRGPLNQAGRYLDPGTEFLQIALLDLTFQLVQRQALCEDRGDGWELDRSFRCNLTLYPLSAGAGAPIHGCPQVVQVRVRLQRRYCNCRIFIELTVALLQLTSYLFNSAARQLVFTESGRAVETVIVDGRVVLFERRSETIDEAALRQVVEESMIVLRKDLDVVQARTEVMDEYLLEAWRRAWAEDIGVERYVGGAGG